MMHRKRTSGFTFVEVVIAISILAVIMSISYGALMQIIRAKKLLDDTRDVKSIADSIIIRFGGELQLAVRSGGEVMPPPNKLSTPYPGLPHLVGTAKRGPDDTSLDSISFIAQNAGQYVPDGGTHNGLIQINYRAEKDPENPDSKSYLLIRDEIPYKHPYDAAYKKIMTFPITKNLVSLRFRYYTIADSAWHDSWGDIQHNQLPNMVKFVFRIRSELGNISEYESAVFLPASQK